MNWRHETWRKLYIREEGSFAALSYSARAAAAMLLKICDEQGRVYSHNGEDILDAICFRLGADRGERRMVKKGVDELVADEHLVKGAGWVRIRNFRRAQGQPESGGPEVAATMLRNGRDGVANDTRPCIEDDATVSRPCIDGVANDTRPCIEDCVNSAESPNCAGVVPSVPSEKFLPSGNPPSTHAGDPSSTEPVAPSPKHGALTAQWLLDKFGELRGGHGWPVASTRMRMLAQEVVDRIGGDPGWVADLAPTMRLSLEQAKDSQDPRDREATWGFGVWVSRLADLREQLHGMRPARRAAPARASPPRDIRHGHAPPSTDFGEPGEQKV